MSAGSPARRLRLMRTCMMSMLCAIELSSDGTRALGLGGHAGKLRTARDAEQTAATARANVAIAVQANHGSQSFERVHAPPEAGIGRRYLKIGIAIVWNDAQNWLQLKFLDQGLDASPALSGHRRTKIIAAKQIFGWRGNHAAASATNACARSFLLQYHR